MAKKVFVGKDDPIIEVGFFRSYEQEKKKKATANKAAKKPSNAKKK